MTASIRLRNAIAGANACAAGSRTTTPQGKSLRGAKAMRVLAHAAREGAAVPEERQQEGGAHGRRPAGAGIGRRDDLARRVDELGREALSGLDGGQESLEGRKLRVEARAGEAGRPSRLIHERDEEEEAARAVRERRERGGRAAAGGDRFLRGRHVEEVVLACPPAGSSQRISPRGLRRKTLEKRRERRYVPRSAARRAGLSGSTPPP